MKVGHGLAVGAILPGRRREVVGGEGGGGRRPRLIADHDLDPVIEGEDLLVGGDRVEPGLAAVEEEHHHVGERAGAEATSDGQVDAVAELPPLPFTVIEVARDGRVAVLDAPAAAAVGADEELPKHPRDVDAPAVGAIDDVPHGQRAAAGACTRATPIMASRVTRAASSDSESPSVPSGRRGSTM